MGCRTRKPHIGSDAPLRGTARAVIIVAGLRHRRRPVKERSIVGDLINFRGLVNSPVNENGVIFLFGKVVEDLDMSVDEVKPGFPDCSARRYAGRGWERAYIEFEYRSSHFKQHGHSPSHCDIKEERADELVCRPRGRTRRTY